MLQRQGPGKPVSIMTYHDIESEALLSGTEALELEKLGFSQEQLQLVGASRRLRSSKSRSPGLVS